MECFHSTRQMTDDAAGADWCSRTASNCSQLPQLSLVGCIHFHLSWNTTDYTYHYRWPPCFREMRLWAMYRTSTCWKYTPVREKRRENDVVSDFLVHGQVIKSHTRYAWQSTHYRNTIYCIKVCTASDRKSKWFCVQLKNKRNRLSRINLIEGWIAEWMGT